MKANICKNILIYSDNINASMCLLFIGIRLLLSRFFSRFSSNESHVTALNLYYFVMTMRKQAENRGWDKTMQQIIPKQINLPTSHRCVCGYLKCSVINSQWYHKFLPLLLIYEFYFFIIQFSDSRTKMKSHRYQQKCGN